MADEENLNEYMSEEKPVSRWVIFKAGLVGAFCGAVITVLFMLLAVLN